MDTFIEVEFDDGLVRHWEFPRASTKEEATVEVDACFGDLTEGIMVTVRHHSAPDDDSDVCRVVKDYRLSLVPPEDMPKLMVCRYCGDERLVRYKDGIVNLTKLKQLSRLYRGRVAVRHIRDVGGRETIAPGDLERGDSRHARRADRNA